MSLHPHSTTNTSNSPHRRPSTPRREETADSNKAGRTWARSSAEDPWAPCILTLDGGGIRGYSSLVILRALMREVWVWEGRVEEEEKRILGVERTDGDDGSENEATKALRPRPASPDDLLPCHYFDFLYGTSTGGIIATILGRLRMTVPEALDLYRQVGDDLFGRRRSNIPLTTKYHHAPLERAVRRVVAARCVEHDKCDGEDLHPWDADVMASTLVLPIPFSVERPRVCQSCCLTATHDGNISEAYLLRTYPFFYTSAPNWITRYNEGADLLPIWAVTRATSAAPFYFDSLVAMVDGEPRAFKDGGIRENNPSGAALSEFHALYDGVVDEPALLLSVGTGRPDATSKDGFATAWPAPWNRLPALTKFLEKRAVIRNLLIKYTEGERQHHQMREHSRGENNWYKRLNAGGLERMPLDRWVRGPYGGQDGVPGGATLSYMEEVTEKYLRRPFDPDVDSYARPEIMLQQAAEKLVRQRRARERLGGERWEVFVGREKAGRMGGDVDVRTSVSGSGSPSTGGDKE